MDDCTTQKRRTTQHGHSDFFNSCEFVVVIMCTSSRMDTASEEAGFMKRTVRAVTRTALVLLICNSFVRSSQSFGSLIFFLSLPLFSPLSLSLPLSWRLSLFLCQCQNAHSVAERRTLLNTWRSSDSGRIAVSINMPIKTTDVSVHKRTNEGILDSGADDVPRNDTSGEDARLRVLFVPK